MMIARRLNHHHFTLFKADLFELLERDAAQYMKWNTVVSVRLSTLGTSQSAAEIRLKFGPEKLFPFKFVVEAQLKK